ncbi:saccharopine dehydrogenase NADP-binding domain-containing protein [Candidatus Venteria ishoeyi]|uniref:saccharopine dehydrogenase NADP-binding domain-containing protein n=1 Tax=Candidatus Venteria ishoeyi TaxID=1899563 RepID=UPI0025A5C523|nr:saccharopine dehydrogenase NADP-binding domain-containing protein [Candidatus Venteria ishoeyi]MDM8545024.1 saccharopine dehydrogenase NADP-binding domain-containing protein [Candidatus Venteria ishoeyi]
MNNITQQENNNKKDFLIIGGYGNAGFALAYQLLKNTQATLLIAGRNQHKAKAVAGDLNAMNAEEWIFRVSGTALDVTDKSDLYKVFSQVSCVILAAPLIPFLDRIVDAVVATGIDCIDLQTGGRSRRILAARKNAITQAGCCFIANAGFSPGLPAILLRRFGDDIEKLKTVRFNLLQKIDWDSAQPSDARLAELLEIIDSAIPQLYQNGTWQKAKFWQHPKCSFPGISGHYRCHPVKLAELENLPQHYPHLEKLSFNQADLNTIFNRLLVPLAGHMPAETYRHKQVQRARQVLSFSAKPPFKGVMQAIFQGTAGIEDKQISVTIQADNLYELTGIAAAACILQYLDGTIKQPGLWYQGLLLDPVRMLKDMQMLGADIETKSSIV